MEIGMGKQIPQRGTTKTLRARRHWAVCGNSQKCREDSGGLAFFWRNEEGWLFDMMVKARIAPKRIGFF